MLKIPATLLARQRGDRISEKRQLLAWAGASCAGRRMAGTTSPGHFARTGPVLGHPVWADFLHVDFALAGLVSGGFACAPLPVRSGRSGPVGAFAPADTVLEHSSQPVLEDFA
jgi:hypothetical protein